MDVVMRGAETRYGDVDRDIDTEVGKLTQVRVKS